MGKMTRLGCGLAAPAPHSPLAGRVTCKAVAATRHAAGRAAGEVQQEAGALAAAAAGLGLAALAAAGPLVALGLLHSKRAERLLAAAPPHAAAATARSGQRCRLQVGMRRVRMGTLRRS